MAQYYLAIDIGASSGRHILAHMENGEMVLEEIHRFPNGMVEKDGEMVWDVDSLFAEIKAGLKKCKEQGKVPVSVAFCKPNASPSPIVNVRFSKSTFPPVTLSDPLNS